MKPTSAELKTGTVAAIETAFVRHWGMLLSSHAMQLPVHLFVVSTSGIRRYSMKEDHFKLKATSASSLIFCRASAAVIGGRLSLCVPAALTHAGSPLAVVLTEKGRCVMRLSTFAVLFQDECLGDFGFRFERQLIHGCC